jgi:serine/threonine protein phosphatase PrpC
LCNAGHPAPLLYRQTDRKWHPLPRRSDKSYATNLPLGIEEGGGYDEQVLGLEPGDAVLLYTDGLIEATASDGGQLGTEGLIELLGELGEPDADDLPSVSGRILEATRSRGYDLEGDDVSIVVLRCNERSNGAGVGETLSAMGRTLRGIAKGDSIPWPEASVRNLLGGVIPPLSRVKPKKGDGS